MTKYFLPPDQIKTLERDGLGWGHDVTAGEVRMDWSLPRRRPVLTRFGSLFYRRAGK